MQPLIKWPGGKSSEIDYIKDIIPKYDRYVEPFCGGGAVYFYLEPGNAIINDISKNLTDFYRLIKNKDEHFKNAMYDLNYMWEDIKKKGFNIVNKLVELFESYKNDKLEKNTIQANLFSIVNELISKPYIIESDLLKKEIKRTLIDKFFRTYKKAEVSHKYINIQVTNELSLLLDDIAE